MFAKEFLCSVYLSLLFTERGMRMRVLRIVCVCMIWMGMMTGPHVQAIESGDTTLLPLPQLLATAYQTKDAGKDLQYVELYNAGNTMARLQDWTFHDAANNRDLQVTSTYSGWLEPGKHIVAARAEIVPGATFTITGWSAAGNGAVMTSLQIMRSGYRTLDANFSSKTDDRDKMMTRVYNSESYSTASSPFVQNYRMAPQPLLFDDGLYAAPAEPGLKIVEIYPYSSDCSPFDTSVLCGDYIKLYNPSDSAVDLTDLALRTNSSSSSRTSSNTFTLAGQLLPGEYYTIWQTDAGARISLTNSGGYIWLEDAYGTVQYQSTLAHYESAGSSQQGYAYAQDVLGNWQWTSTPKPGAANEITVPTLIACEEGKYRNPDTGRCRTLEETINALAACEEGYERNPTTNRCRKIATATTASLTPCKEGQERNPETNRCRSIASAVAELIPCDEGYERNPATNRCRKVQSGQVPSAAYPVEPYDQTASGATTWWVIGSIGVFALGYGAWEWRREIGAGFAKILALVTTSSK